MGVIAFILLLIFLKLPEERRTAILKLVEGIFLFILSVVTLDILGEINNWKNDR